MLHIRPFRALRPRPEHASAVAAVPYDVVSTAEARELARGNPLSFLRVTRPEIDLPDDVPAHSSRAHARAKRTLDELVGKGILAVDSEAGIFLYRLTRHGHSQTGVAAVVSVDDYLRGVVKRHELTHREKEDDRMRHSLAIGAHPGPVLMAYRDDQEVESLMVGDTAGPPLYDFTAADGVRHTVWRVRDPATYVEAFARHAAAYIADGHHRSASAARVAEAMRDAHPDAGEDAPFHHFLAVLFPAGGLNILPYHRLVRDLGDLTPEAFLERVAATGVLESGADPRRVESGSCAINLEGRWHALRFRKDPDEASDPVRSLDYDWVQRRIFDELLGISDPRSNPRVECVGGIRGPEELERRVNRGEAALAVAMPATRMEEVLRVADAGAIMPPKSTWFEPKLRSGLLVHRIVPGK